MSNTLKFGDGVWAVKEGSTLAYNDTNGNYKPLPFTFDRAGSATRVNKQGLIEVVSNNEPRIDFSNDSKGALLLEPAATNLLQYSEDFSNADWGKNQSSVTPNATISPDGTLNASKLIEDNTSNFHRILEGIDVVSSDYSHTVFAKAAERKYFVLRNNINGSNVNACFDLEDGVVVYSGFDETKIEYYGNGWYRCFIKETSTSTFLTSISLMTSDKEILNNNIPSYQGDGTSGLYIWGAQLEQGSYATSYIPTQGSIGTRDAESCEQTPPSGIIGQTEGTVYTELNMSNIGTNFIFSIDDGGASDFIILDTNSIGELDLQVRQSSGSITTIISGSALIEGSNKIAIRYKSGDYSLYLNGVLQGTSTSTLFPSGTISRVSVGANSSYGFLSNSVKDFKLYETALTNTQLQVLTKI